MKAALRAIPVVERKGNGDPRHCWKCDAFKPDRTHHCSVCAECVLKMDHHCLWVGNCIGFFNHKFFLLFLFYGVLSSLFVCVSMFPRMVHAFRPVWDIESFLVTDCPVIACYIFCMLVFIVIGTFLGFHMHVRWRITLAHRRVIAPASVNASLSHSAIHSFVFCCVVILVVAAGVHGYDHHRATRKAGVG
jgi:hypothetical protein